MLNVKNKNIIILSKNYEKYLSGSYHQDIIDSLCKLANTYLYGYGYKNYSLNDNFENVIEKSPFKIDNVDLIICSTSWDDDSSITNVDPHPNIKLGGIHQIPKIYFLNKEYKKLELRFKYIQHQKFDLVCTVHPKAYEWSETLGIKFLHLPFGVSLDRFSYLDINRKYDFAFTGAVHKNYIDYRYLVKCELFKSQKLEVKSNLGLNRLLNTNPISKKFQKYNIYWAEWGARSLTYKSLLPTGLEYVKLMNMSKVFLNTPSAVGIFNTRFFELMATKTLILCPESDSYLSLLKDGINCVMYNPNMSDFDEKLVKCIEDNHFRKTITDNAYKNIEKHSYDARIATLLDYIEG